MGEYEPEDSRAVTLRDARAPGEPPRTGPREDQARRMAAGAGASQRQVQGSQMRGQALSGGQAQARAGAMAASAIRPGDPDRQAMQAEPGGALAGNQPQAIDSPAGAARPQYDQYEVTHPQHMHRVAAEDERKIREQAAMQHDTVGGFDHGIDGEETGEATGPGSSDGGSREHLARFPADRREDEDKDEDEETYERR